VSLSKVACPLCHTPGGQLIFEDDHWRIIRVLNEPAFPAFYRLISQVHATEWTDLPYLVRQKGWAWLETIERVLRDGLHPTKINWASLGNQVSHVHVHVIARFSEDAYFPQSVWGTSQRALNALQIQAIIEKLSELDYAIQNGSVPGSKN
jgi:diadenosine tetraphosphate (Ap4A) HIT family hydrolase